MSLSNLIFAALINSEEYGRKVLPYVREEYFDNSSDKIIFNVIQSYVDKYNKFPNQLAVKVDIEQLKLDDRIYRECSEKISGLEHDASKGLEWLIDKTEKFCQERAVYNAIMASIQILDNKDPKNSKGSIPKMLQDALAVSFDTHIGHDFIDDSDPRFEYYRRIEDRVPFRLEYLNRITKNGLPKKTLNVILAGPHVGKSLFMCSTAAGNLLDGKNVLYITMEMAEEEIARRIDANILDIPIEELDTIPKEIFDRKMNRVKGKTSGKLIIKEYPTSTAGSANFRHLLMELRIKRNFIPDIVYIDYLNICASSRIKMGSNVNSYTYIKAVAEELRGLAVEFCVPIVSATQTTRSGHCLDPNTIVVEKGGVKKLSEINIGDQVLSNDGWNTVKTIFAPKKKKMYRIHTESGKTIVASADHLFPTENGEKNIANGLCLKDRLFIKNKMM